MKLNRAVPITGIYVADAPDETFPLQGVAVLLATATSRSAHRPLDGAEHLRGPDPLLQHAGGPTFEGTGGVDETGDGVIDSTLYAWAATDCKAVVVP